MRFSISCIILLLLLLLRFFEARMIGETCFFCFTLLLLSPSKSPRVSSSPPRVPLIYPVTSFTASFKTLRLIAYHVIPPKIAPALIAAPMKMPMVTAVPYLDILSLIEACKPNGSKVRVSFGVLSSSSIFFSKFSKNCFVFEVDPDIFQVYYCFFYFVISVYTSYIYIYIYCSLSKQLVLIYSLYIFMCDVYR